MNERTLKNGERITEQDFQAMLTLYRVDKPQATEEEYLAYLNKHATTRTAQAKKKLTARSKK